MLLVIFFKFAICVIPPSKKMQETFLKEGYRKSTLPKNNFSSCL